MKCLNCGKDFKAKRKDAKFDTDNCRIEYNRNKRKGLSVSKPTRNVTNVTDNKEHTVTDKLFIDDILKRYPDQPQFKDWYNFGKDIHDRKCIQCSDLFQTRLQLNKFCSPKCRDNAMKGVT